MLEEHKKELEAPPRGPIDRIAYALGILSDVIDGDMVGEVRNIHIQDAKEIIVEALKGIVFIQ